LFVLPRNSSTPPEAGSYVLLENAGPELPKIESLLPCFIVEPRGLKPEIVNWGQAAIFAISDLLVRVADLIGWVNQERNT